MKLECENISKSLGHTRMLKGATFSIPDCKSLMLLGPSGSGKSTLLRVFAGLVIPDEGKVLLNDQLIPRNESELLPYRRSIGTVFQSWNLFPHLTVEKNILLPLTRVHNLPQQEALERARSLLRRFGLESRAHQYPSELSGGENQRVAIVRAAAIQPKLLLFDEPTSALDPLMTAEVLDLIAELKQEGSDFILVSHHLGFAKKISDYIAFVHEGKVLEARPTPDFFASPHTPEAKAFLEKIFKY